MKKHIFVLALTASMLAATSCDPLKDEGTFEVNNPNAETLLKGATFKQYNGIKAEDGTMTYEPCDDGNYIEYSIPSVPAVTIYYVKPDGSQNILTYGTNAGMFYYKPMRGSEPVQDLYIQYVNADLKETVATKQFTLQVAQELSAGDKLLCSNSGAKKWYWFPTEVNGGAVWGNAGYQAGVQENPNTINGAWWGCGVIDGDCPNTFADQMQHSAVGSATGEEYQDSYMQFNEDGSLTKVSPDGTLLATGKFELVGYNNGQALDDMGTVATLKTSEGAIMWPYAINMNGFQPTEFQVTYLSVDHMILQYAPAGTGAWEECTWWSYVNYDDAEGFVTNGQWGWYPTEVNGGAVWGNAGYMAGAQENINNINGAWWGCGVIDGDCPNTFADQMQHSAVGSETGEEYSDSYMVFNEDGSIVKYGNDGSKLGESKWELDMTPNAETFSLGSLKTDGILWPYAINTGGQIVNEYAIGYISGSNMILIYAPAGTGAWEECTWWSFAKK